MMIFALYRILTILAGPLIWWHLRRRLKRGKEDAARFGERLGKAGKSRPEGRLVWLHGASVGEALSLLPLVNRLVERGNLAVLVTTGTVTSAALMTERLPPGAVHQYVPVDRPAWVNRFLDHWRPDLVLWAESDFWPNLLDAIDVRAIPLVLVQGRVSPTSFAGWKRWAPGLIHRMLSAFTLCLGQTPGDTERLAALGAAKTACLGNLKMAVPPLPVEAEELARLRRAIGVRPLWLAASTHPGEERLIAQVHQALAPRFPGLLTLIAPRHPHRAAEIATEIADMGLSVALRSAGDAPGGDIYLADTMGELGLFFRLAPIVFMGKSLAAEGGQNPFEPARLGAAVLFGPRMSNFPEMAPAMIAATAAEEIADENGLADAVARLLADPALLAQHRDAAATWAESEAHVLDAVLATLAPFLDSGHARP